MYIKIDINTPGNLKNIICESGEILGIYTIETDENGAKTPVNIQLFENCYFITNDMIIYPVSEKKSGNCFDIVNLKYLKKPDEILKKEKYGLLCLKILNHPGVKELKTAINDQINVKNEPGINLENIMFDNAESIAWLNWYYTVAKNNHDLSGLTIEEININMFGEIPTVPESFQRFLPLGWENEFN